MGSGSRNAGWPLQLLKHGPPLVVRSWQGRAVWGRSQASLPTVGRRNKSFGAASSRRSNSDNTRALLNNDILEFEIGATTRTQWQIDHTCLARSLLILPIHTLRILNTSDASELR
jgi:hypothetical protein